MKIMSIPTACHLTAKCKLSPSAFPAVTRFRSFGDERTCIKLLHFQYLGSRYGGANPTQKSKPRIVKVGGKLMTEQIRLQLRTKLLFLSSQFALLL